MLNLVGGLVLLFSDREDSDQVIDSKLTSLARHETFRLVLGILAAITGFFKLLSVIRGDVPVVGDLLPSLSGLACGFIFLYEFYRTRTALDEESIPVFLKSIVNSRKYVGVISVCAAVLHFLFPTILFL